VGPAREAGASGAWQDGAVHDAKRWVRKQEKWKSPYYWGTFVLVGPH
jgi:CHAT domain-containing protein